MQSFNQLPLSRRFRDGRSIRVAVRTCTVGKHTEIILNAHNHTEIIRAGPSTSSSTGFHLAGVSETGEAYVWQCAPSTSGRQAEEGGVEGRLVAHVRVDGSQG